MASSSSGSTSPRTEESAAQAGGAPETPAQRRARLLARTRELDEEISRHLSRIESARLSSAQLAAGLAKQNRQDDQGGSSSSS